MASIGSVIYMLRKCGWSDSPDDIYDLEANAQQAQLVLLMAANRSLLPVLYCIARSN